MMQNILIGAVLSFPIAWIGKRTVIGKNLRGEQFTNNNIDNNDINHDAENNRNNL